MTATNINYLDSYLESVASLPQEVRRNFILLRELDQQSQQHLEEADKKAKAYLKGSRKNKERNLEEEKQIKGELKKTLELGDEKVQLAVQTYELVDKHIRRLDQDLKKFEAELAAETGTSVSTSTNSKDHGKLIAGSGKKTDARVQHVDSEMPVDPYEPTYCTCNRVSFGEMVGCDNQDCKIEWFHFECVGLTNPPKGKWYCPDCTAIRKKNKQ